MNLTIVERKKEVEINKKEEKIKKINVSNNPNCLLLKKKGEKISRNERCEVTGKKFKQCCGALYWKNYYCKSNQNNCKPNLKFKFLYI